MSDYPFVDRPSNDGIYASGDGYRRSPQDLFGGDFYAEDEPVRRGVVLARPQLDKPLYDDMTKEGLFGLPQGSRRLTFPGCEGVELEVRDVDRTGKSLFCSANATDLACAVLDYFVQQDAVAMPREQKRAIKVHLCANYAFLKIKVSLCVPKDAPDMVALTWERKQGDSGEFISTLRGCNKYLTTRGFSCQEQTHGPTGLAAQIPPHLAMPSLGGEWPRPLAYDLGDQTPNFLAELPALDVEPCKPEDMEPLLNMATESNGASRAEAAVAFCRAVDQETDSEVVAQVLQANPQVLIGLLEESACVYSAPALAEKLAARAPEMDWAAVAKLLVARLASESPLGQRLLSRSLATVLAHHGAVATGLLADVTAAKDRVEDQVTRHRLREGCYALQAQPA